MADALMIAALIFFGVSLILMAVTCAVALLMWIVAATVRYALGTGPRV